MSSRNEYRDQGQLEPGVIKRYARIAIGASGAPTFSTTGGPSGQNHNKGLASISRTSAGLYVLTFQDTFQRVLGLEGVFTSSTGIPAAPAPVCLKTDSVGTRVSPNGGTLTFTTGAFSGGSGAFVATDPGSGEILLLEITLSNSAAQ